VSPDFLGDAAREWLALGQNLPATALRLVLADIDGVITRGEGQPAELDVFERLAAINAKARHDPCVPAITLCTGRQAPYVELVAQLTATFLPCIFEHGAGIFFPTAFRYEFDPRLGADYSARLARLRAGLQVPLIQSGQAFIQPGKEASMTLYPLGDTTVDDLLRIVERLVPQIAPEFSVARNVNGVELRPLGTDKGTGALRIAGLLKIPLAAMVGVGDSDPDLSYLTRVGFSAAPANATPAVRQAVKQVASEPFGAGLLEIVTLVEQHNREQTLTKTSHCQSAQ
jgi:hydroxymethylpyrimidine pyrophosphatase-like HAD family hydrolase